MGIDRQPNSKLRAVRIARNESQREFTEAVMAKAREMGLNLACDEKRVGRWERGEVSWPTPAYRRVLKALTGKDAAELGLRYQPPQEERDAEPDEPITPRAVHATHTVDSGGGDPVQRREFLGLAGATAAMAVTPASLLAPHPAPAVSAADVEDLAALLDRYGRQDTRRGGGAVAIPLRAYVEELINPALAAPTASPKVRQDLCRVAAEATARVAWVLVDAGQASEAREWFGRALALAHQAGDLATAALVLALMGLVEVEARRPVDAVRWTSAAVELAGRVPGEIRAVLLGHQARAVALAGDEHQALTLVGRAIDAYSAASPLDPRAGWMGTYSDSYAHYHRAVVLAEIAQATADRRRAREAAAAAELSLSIRPESAPWTRNTAFCAATAARAYASAGELDAAVGHARTVVTLAGELASTRVRAHLTELADALSRSDYRPAREVVEQARPLLAAR
ncbi:hypothetical protein C3Y87_01790 [Carbonactinospora thermoautotrophica]|uniref:hypothetical protein n=1 Tax=Carbonactinospora thermoautotrophica TaxID=1469144 RepID=UPI00227170D5|nr:hypothetical protein [Carbonactinospora thermoautotrophica]MCX9190164.1 hypothetical protein [Carbonactinospora thermoautotrophica]